MADQAGTGTSAILAVESTDKYYIEYGGYRSNHLAHGVIALDRLGASTSRLNQFVAWYKKRLESPEDNKDEVDQATTVGGIKGIKGARRSYYSLVQHYTDLLKKCASSDELIHQEFPKLSQGMVGSLLHGIIHLGYGQAARSEKVVVEGLSYLHHSFLPLDVTRPESLVEPLGSPGDLGILDVLALVKKDASLAEVIQVRGNDPNDPKLASLGTHAEGQRRLCSLLAYKADELVRYANRIKLPEFYDPSKAVVEQRDALMKWIVDCAVKLYVMCGSRNDFVVLHAVTSAWSLKTVLSLVDDSDQIILSVRVFLSITLAVYAYQECPAMNAEFLPRDTQNIPPWEKIIADTVGRLEEDEHIYKLVQVCHDMATDYPDDHQMAPVYREAANVSLIYPLQLNNEPFKGGPLPKQK